MKYIKTYEQSNSLDLINAVKNNDLIEVKKLIKAGTDLNKQDEHGYTGEILSGKRDSNPRINAGKYNL